MRYLKGIRESESLFKNITKEDKNYLDIIFADFIDNGSKSELYQYDITHMGGESIKEVSYTGYRIKIDLLSMIDIRYKNIQSIKSLLGQIDSLKDISEDLEVCIKRAYQEFKCRAYIYADGDVEHELNLGGYRTVKCNSPYSMIIEINF